MILKESELDDVDIIHPILGKPYKEPGKLLTATGSTIYSVKECTDLLGNPLPLKRDEMKAIFQRYEKGLMLFFTKSNYQNAILLDYDSIKSIELEKGKETISVWFSPLLALLTKLGFSLKNARYFFFGMGFKVEETVLVVTSSDYKIRMETNGFSFNSQAKYFNKLRLGTKFKLVIPDKKPEVKLL